MTPQEWVRGYALLALRVNRQMAGAGGGMVLIYRGPQEWSTQVEQEEPPPPGRLVDDAEALLEDPPFQPGRVRYLRAQVRALPRRSGTLAERLWAWQGAHTLPPDRLGRLPALVKRAVAETRRRTAALVPLPDGEKVDCQIRHGVHYLAAGHYAGIHRARNALFGVWANAAVQAAEGRPEDEIAAYLSRWALLPDAETAAALGSLRATGLYVLGYYHGWRLLNSWLAAPDRTARVRRLLTEQLLPADLTS